MVANIKRLQNEESLEEYLVSKGTYVIAKYLRTFTEEEYEDITSGALLSEIADFIEKIYLAIEHYKI